MRIVLRKTASHFCWKCPFNLRIVLRKTALHFCWKCFQCVESETPRVNPAQAIVLGLATFPVINRAHLITSFRTVRFPSFLLSGTFI
ncbi:hypothetical protein CQ059_03610 [Brucella pseudogrignonensis]|nr:hypothetical protein [Ochrobactrum sp. MYb237]PQZ43052.1 hypothetical protein CQ059_03610 [Brucella pseudogrignonensis]PRA42798.1 hypothetical protein CQ063_00095 [Brucella pseudogrignonensis]PRA72735.1 hypothetical protein CQ055_05490 [Brucella pseudogrignonensis]